ETGSTGPDRRSGLPTMTTIRDEPRRGAGRAAGRRRDPWAAAVVHLRAVDPRWGPVIDRIGPCRLRPRRQRFGTLVRAIIGQQISTRAAATIDARLRAVAGATHDPFRLLELG